MTSQLDLDQGGTFREWVSTYFGPSVGWVRVPAKNILSVNAAGIFTVDPSTNLVRVRVAGIVTIILPSAVVPTVPAGVLPGLFTLGAITITDIGGFAAANPITIQPAPTENIMGLSSIQLNSNYGSFVLFPVNGLRGWTS